ncbi:hypothetical protein CYY_005293 [Polysphondylium violaceum]|uniref:Transmembrane protein n=1 Tax=Polysphondylium violaceum TaxID=133409 RepID=A0A8J4UYQ4_9MYCE|nr:hypothetical protein CYY_005293 [Polysphondylium violaceum]
MNEKFQYPLTSPFRVIVRSKRRGFLKRHFNDDMPIELNPYVPQENYANSIKYLNQVAFYTILGQLVSILPVLVCGIVMFAVGEARRQSTNYTPIYWYIGILILGVSFLCLLVAIFTLRSRYIRNLSYAVQKIHTEYNNSFGIQWVMKYVEFENRKGKRRIKLWCELIIPNSPIAQQPLVAHPQAYPQHQQNQAQYVPMAYYYGNQKPGEPLPPPTAGPSQPFSGYGQQLGGGPSSSSQIPQPNGSAPYYSYPQNNYVNIPIDQEYPPTSSKPNVNLDKESDKK